MIDLKINALVVMHYQLNNIQLCGLSIMFEYLCHFIIDKTMKHTTEQ